MPEQQGQGEHEEPEPNAKPEFILFIELDVGLSYSEFQALDAWSRQAILQEWLKRKARKVK